MTLRNSIYHCMCPISHTVVFCMHQFDIVEDCRLETSNDLHRKRVDYGLGLNQQILEMGMPVQHIFNASIVDQQLNVLDRQFDLVMIAERFDQSMVLLANELCWDLKQVVSLKLNIRSATSKASFQLVP